MIETSTVTFSEWNEMVGKKLQERICELEEKNRKLKEQLHKTQLALERKNRLIKELRNDLPFPSEQQLIQLKLNDEIK